MTFDDKKEITKALTFVAIIVAAMFWSLYCMLDHDRSKMMAFIAKCEAGGNHAVMNSVSNGACYKGAKPELVERYNYEFK